MRAQFERYILLDVYSHVFLCNHLLNMRIYKKPGAEEKCTASDAATIGSHAGAKNPVCVPVADLPVMMSQRRRITSVLLVDSNGRFHR